ncbi:MAG TPA: hypothetical protein VGS00_00405, partial [Thermoanaerobaculia bacterium]|nr:hypothetical protein [Thermoanaerobaculia bacterium]
MSKDKAVSPWLYFASGATVGVLIGVATGVLLEAPFWLAALVGVGSGVVYGLIAVATEQTLFDLTTA